MNKLKLLLSSSRPISWINTAYPFAFAYLATNQSSPAIFIIGTLYFLIPYNLLMYGINDVFDYESDIKNPRKGGVEGAKIPKNMHRFVLHAAALANVPFLMYLLANGTATSNLVLLLVVLLVVAYSMPPLRFKERALLDSITSSMHFVGPAIFALSLVGLQLEYAPLLLAFFCWGMASHAFGAVQDIKFDRQAGIGSIATLIGASWTVWFAMLLYAISSVILLSSSLTLLPVALCGLLYIINIWGYRSVKDTDSARTNTAWRRFIWLNWITGAVVTVAALSAQVTS